MTDWKGRFKKNLHPLALKYSSSLEVDVKLYKEDIEGSIVHVTMLAMKNIISPNEAKKIKKALREICSEIGSGKLLFNYDHLGNNRFVAEDIHMAIENRLIQKLGALGGKLHTARSRNDQIALDERLYLRSNIFLIKKLIYRLQKSFVSKAEEYKDTVMPGYTHLQRAQPIFLPHHLLAYVEMFERDKERFSDCLERVNRSPLGASALAGTSYRIDRRLTASLLGFDDIVINSIDAVSDRDVHIEFISACALTMMHLSRFAEDIILWSSQEWNFAEIGDDFTTGSSIMPQKKNPDIAELVRGKTGRVYGNLMALLTVMKGLPLAYNRDLQEDKEPMFDTVDTVTASLEVSAKMISGVKFNKTRFEKELNSDFLIATELADYLVRKGLPFRKAHSVVGNIISDCIEKKIYFRDLSLNTYRQYSKYFSEDIFKIIEVRKSLSLKKSTGSTSPREVQKRIQYWKNKFNKK